MALLCLFEGLAAPDRKLILTNYTKTVITYCAACCRNRTKPSVSGSGVFLDRSLVAAARQLL